MKNELEERIIKTDKGYFFDTEAGYYIKLSDEIADVIEAPSSDFQEEGERWTTVEDLINEYMEKIPSILSTEKADVEEIARLIYEATRIEARWSNRSIVPEEWEDRDEKFRSQFVEIIRKYMSLDTLPTPTEAHNSWMKSYFDMGWKYGLTPEEYQLLSLEA